ncbi:hypothetical protein [Marinicrinis lubricantis]|uniref:Uncharacterized protein n=1 Tax=Marinicrinis lubricantis TaxID=2086470 RepID=A0ABW1IR43_9BACL
MSAYERQIKEYDENLAASNKLKRGKKIKYIVGGILLGILFAWLCMVIAILIINGFNLADGLAVFLVLIAMFGPLLITPKVVYTRGKNKYDY